MNAQASEERQNVAESRGELPRVEAILSDVIATLALAANGYLSEDNEHQPDYEAADTAIAVAGVAFERIKDRLRPDERLSFTQLLTETRMSFVRKRGL